jgi:hypothetical protein
MPHEFLSPNATDRASSDLLELVTELIDAHADTVELLLADDFDEMARWAHLNYLRSLQRLGHQTLAHHDRSAPRPAAVAGLPEVTRAARRAIASSGTSATRLLAKCSAPVAILVRAAAPMAPRARGLEADEFPHPG